MPGLTGSRAAASVQEETQAHVRCKEAVLPGMLAWAPAQLLGSAHRYATAQERSQAHAGCKQALWLGMPACLPSTIVLTIRFHTTLSAWIVSLGARRSTGCAGISFYIESGGSGRRP